MLNLAADLAADLHSAAPRVRRVVTFELAEGETHHFCQGEAGFTDPDGYFVGPSVSRVTPFSTSVDPVTRKTAIGTVSVTMKADGVGQALLRNVVVGKLLRIRFGTERVPLSSYITEWVGVIRKPSIARNGEVTFDCDDALGPLSELNITGGWIDHPVEALRQIFSDHVVPTAWRVDGFDAGADPAKSHLNLARYEDVFVQSVTDGDQVLDVDGLLSVPANALDLAHGLLECAGGTLRPGIDGQLEHQPFDPAAAPTFHWPRSVWLDAQPTDMLGKIINRIDLKLGRRKATSQSPLRTGFYDRSAGKDRSFPINDAASQAAHRSVGSTLDRIFGEEFDNEWMRAMGQMRGNIDAADTYIEVDSAGILGFCGSRYRHGLFLSQVSGSSVTGNVLTLEIDPTAYGANILPVGALIVTDGLAVDVTTPSPVLSSTPTEVTVALVTADTADNGTGFMYPQQDPRDMLFEGRVAYFLLADSSADNVIEIVRATSGSGPSFAEISAPFDPEIDYLLGSGSPPTEQQKRRTYPGYYGYTIERGLFGTTPRDFAAAPTILYDITIGVLRAQETVNRHSYGAPESIRRTFLSEMAVQIGDVGTIDDPEYRSPGRAGADATGPVFEVVSKNADIDSSPPSIEWKLVWLRDEV